MLLLWSTEFTQLRARNRTHAPVLGDRSDRKLRPTPEMTHIAPTLQSQTHSVPYSPRPAPTGPRWESANRSRQKTCAHHCVICWKLQPHFLVMLSDLDVSIQASKRSRSSLQNIRTPRYIRFRFLQTICIARPRDKS